MQSKAELYIPQVFRTFQGFEIKDIKERGDIEVILHTYFDRKRGSKFSLSNELISCCSKYFKLAKEDFDNAPLNEIKDIKNDNKNNKT